MNINVSQLRQVLALTPAEHNIMLVGRHGVGKSEILTRYYNELGIDVVTLFLGQMADPGDLIGLPVADPSERRTTFAPPFWFPTDGKPIVLFLDELNRARNELLQAVMDLALNRTIAGRRLPEGSRVVAACNSGDEYQLTELDPALVARFDVYQFQPTVEEWLAWARTSGVDERVLHFIIKNPHLLEQKGRTSDDMEKAPDRRAWTRLGRFLTHHADLDDVMLRMAASMVGPTAASLFMNHLMAPTQLDATDVVWKFDQYESLLKNSLLHQITTLTEEVFGFIESSHSTLARKGSAAKNVEKYFAFLAGRGDREAAAHCLAIFDSGRYPAANQYIEQCGEAMSLIRKSLI